LYLRSSSELKQEIEEYAAGRNRCLSDLLMEAFGIVMRRDERELRRAGVGVS
jgi:hypothetical protein